VNRLEDRLVRDLRARAEHITPSSVPRLRLPGPVGDQARTLRRRAAWHRWWSWFAPVAAAAAVVAVVAASLAISGALSGHRPGNRPAQRGPFSGVPPYYVALAVKNPNLKPAGPQRQFAEVRATATGAVLAVVTPPKPYGTFTAAAAGDGHTFVLAAEKWKVRHVNGGTFVGGPATTFFLLRIGPGGHVGQLTPLPIPAVPAQAGLSGFALSHDGSKLAVALRGGDGGPGPEIQVFSLSTGAERVWTWPGGGPITNNAGDQGQVLSWTADGRTLAFQQWVGNRDINVRLLDVTTPGGSLRSASRLAVQWKDDAESLHFVHGKASNVIEGFSAIITGDGTKIVAATVSETKHPLESELAFTEFSTSTGQVVKVLGRWPLPGYVGGGQDVLWANSSGSTLIVLAHVPGPAVKDPDSTNLARYRIEFGVQRGDQFTPLPGAPRPGPYAWPTW